MSLLLTTTIRWRGRGQARALDAAAQAPATAQTKRLQTILGGAANTLFGQRHGFSYLFTPAEYRQAVPIQDYEGFRPYVERIMAGEAHVLTPDPVQMFTLTSGTTSQPKYIPVTRTAEAGGSALMGQWLYRLLQDYPHCLSGAVVGIVSPAIEGYTVGGIPYGSLSGRIYQKLPAPVRRTYAIPYGVFEIADYEARYRAIARFALAQAVRFLCTPNPSTLLRLATVMTQHRETLIRAIHDGTLGVPVETAIAHQLRPYLRPDPLRARVLEQIATATDALRPRDCWPDLTLLSCWLGGSVGLQAQQLSQLYGPVPQRDLGYMASEARMTLPYQDRTSSGILDLTLNYYEFIPEAEVDSPQPTVLMAHELELGQRYSLLLTTPAGLYRYHLHDIVEVTGFYYRAPLLAFVRKGKDMSNLTGEKLHVNQVMAAMAQAQAHCSLAIDHYQLRPEAEELRYHLYVEPRGEVGDGDRYGSLLAAFDRSLGEMNLEYAQKRASARLQAPILHLMARGWGEAVQARAIASGKRDVQYKWPILCPTLAQEDEPWTVATLQRT